MVSSPGAARNEQPALVGGVCAPRPISESSPLATFAPILPRSDALQSTLITLPFQLIGGLYTKLRSGRFPVDASAVQPAFFAVKLSVRRNLHASTGRT
jgi:hypothetical protein